MTFPPQLRILDVFKHFSYDIRFFYPQLNRKGSSVTRRGGSEVKRRREGLLTPTAGRPAGWMVPLQRSAARLVARQRLTAQISSIH